MIALDTNILVSAHRRDHKWHGAALAATGKLAGGLEPWAIPWPCLHEFLGIVTHRRVFSPPSTIAEAVDQVDAWLESPTVQLLAESALAWPNLRDLLVASKVVGPRVHDARIAALCQMHGVSELWSADRDFKRFPGLRTRNPLRPSDPGPSVTI